MGKTVSKLSVQLVVCWILDSSGGIRVQGLTSIRWRTEQMECFAQCLSFLWPCYQGASRVLYSLLKIRKMREVRERIKLYKDVFKESVRTIYLIWVVFWEFCLCIFTYAALWQDFLLDCLSVRYMPSIDVLVLVWSIFHSAEDLIPDNMCTSCFPANSSINIYDSECTDVSILATQSLRSISYNMSSS